MAIHQFKEERKEDDWRDEMSAKDFLKDIFIENRQNAIWNVGRVLGLKHPERSEFWKESVEHYQGLDSLVHDLSFLFLERLFLRF